MSQMQDHFSKLYEAILQGQAVVAAGGDVEYKKSAFGDLFLKTHVGEGHSEWLTEEEIEADWAEAYNDEGGVYVR